MSQTLDTLDLKLLQALEPDGLARRFRWLRTTAGLRVTGVTDESRLGRTGCIVRLGRTPNVAEQLSAAIAALDGVQTAETTLILRRVTALTYRSR